FHSLSEPIAAASIAQVHRARTRARTAEEEERDVAVKVLRPGIEQRFARDLESFFSAAEQIERRYPPARRLRPVESVEARAEGVTLEVDPSPDAAAPSEMAENIAADTGLRVPRIDEERTPRGVITKEWIDGIPAAERD